MRSHWFEDAADHMKEAYLRYSFTKGTDQEVAFLMKELDLQPGMKLLDVGCGPGRHAHAFAKSGIEVVGIDISQKFVDIASRNTEKGTTFIRMDARELRYEQSFDAVISLCQGAFGLAGKPDHPVGTLDPDGEILQRMGACLVHGGKIAVSAFSAYFQLRYLEDSDTFHADHGVNHELATLQDPEGTEITQDLWTSCFTPRELRLLAEKANLTVESIWSVSPGKYSRTPPTYNHPEFLLIASR
ncbi:MAG: methyltransferase domain-containing protein [Actinomycetota bacterium]|nr:methyltransferase domain-containing protein [Actinomycetota bacterium]